MKHLLHTALAAALLAGLAAAQDESTDEWADLDRQLAELETLEYERVPGPYIWGYLRTNFAFSDNLRVPPNNARLRGFVLDNVRVNVSGESAGLEYRITADLSGGNAFIEDAWAAFQAGEEITATMGRFKSPFLRSGVVEARDLLFITRTRNGVFWSVRDQGAMLNGDHGRVHWAAALQNGADGTVEDWLTTLNLKVNVVGEDELPWEGAYDAGPGTRASLGVSMADDASLGDGTVWALDAYLVHRGISLQAEWLDYGMGYDSTFVGEQRGGTQPWSVTASYMIVPKTYELAVRFDDFDDRNTPLDFKRQTLSFGVNRYISGHDAKWQLQYSDARKSGLSDGPHEILVALGLTVSF
ncbi:MAG: hypothetical protein H6828_06160 [Planctomycetes bacterium]|nr:hypothetical protein [Planctomycetota bacterium]